MTARPNSPDPSAFPLEATCPACHVEIGQAHEHRCEVARCLATGRQRNGHMYCRCPEDVWTGLMSGMAECIEFGWMQEGDPSLPDLNRLYTAATWDPRSRRWNRP